MDEYETEKKRRDISKIHMIIALVMDIRTYTMRRRGNSCVVITTVTCYDKYNIAK